MFEWDPSKAAYNLRKHKIDFEEAKRALEGAMVWAASPRDDENRFACTVEVDGRVIVVIWTPRRNDIRIISARPANEHERTAYRQAFGR